MSNSEEIKKIRHSCSHVMAQAVQELWPGTKLAIGPAIEDGFYYDFDKVEPFVDEDLKKIEKKMRQILEQKLDFIHSTMSKVEALKYFSDKDEKYKVELIENLEDEEVSLYSTGEGWFDLCKGPHVENTKEIKVFKLLSVAGSYWRGDEKREQLQRIYGTAFFTKEELTEHLYLLEEAKKRDHRKLGPQLELFNIYHDTAGAGMAFYLPLGARLRETIESYMKDQNFKRGYEMVVTPHVLKGKLWDISGHSEHYKENMYYLDMDGEKYAVKPMNCPGHMLIYKSKVRSYREFPIRLSELGTVYRQEKAGVLHGLLRVRSFTQDDAHIFCTPKQLKDEIKGVIDFVFDVMKDFGFNDIHIEVSTRPEKFIGEIADWDMATETLKEALADKEIPYVVNEGDGAFYGPKIDFKLRDALKREWQCSTIQCDFSLPERFELTYTDEMGELKRPIMIHRAIFGSLERFIGTLIEHYGGAFPIWLAPQQMTIIPIGEAHKDFAYEVKEILHKEGLRVIIDDRNESLSKRIREGAVKKIPYLLVLGDKEVEGKMLAIRKFGEGDQGSQSVEDFIVAVKQQIKDKQ